MATQVQFRRGNTTQTNTFTGAVAEITVDTDKKTVVVHDGVTAGGFALALESAQQDAQAFAKANAAFSQANGAFDKANTAAVDIIAIQAVNVTQNTNITNAQNTGSASFNHANGAFDKANTNATNITSLEGVNVTQNTNITSAQNTGIAAFNQANSSFEKANTNASDITAIQSVNLTQNTNITTAQNKAEQAFDQANAAYNQANTNAGNITIIEGVNLTQNNSISNLEGVNLTQNTNITATQNKADNAFHQANAAYDQANTNASNITVIQAVNNTQNTNISNIEGVNLTQNTNITNAQNTGDAAFIRANNSLSANAGGVVTAPVTIAANLTITGNLIVVGNTVTQDIATLNIGDPLIYLAANNYSGDAVEIGFAANYYDGATQRHTGVFREASNKEYYVFDNYTPEPEANLIDIGDASFRVATLNANLKSQSITLNNQNLQTYVDGAYNNSNAVFNLSNNIVGVNLTQNTNITTAQNKAEQAFDQANAAFLLANGTATVANTDYTNVSVSAGTYGNSTHYGVVTVAANGRVTSVQTFVVQDSSALAFSIALG